MSKWFYYNESGEKIETTAGRLKGLAKTGQITPDTIIESEGGKTAPARKVKGLTFIAATPPETIQPKQSPPAEPSPFTAVPPTAPNPFVAATFPPENPFTATSPIAVSETISDTEKAENTKTGFQGWGSVVVAVVIVPVIIFNIFNIFSPRTENNAPAPVGQQGAQQQLAEQTQQRVAQQGQAQQVAGQQRMGQQQQQAAQARMREKVNFVIRQHPPIEQFVRRGGELSEREIESIVQFLVLTEEARGREYWEVEIRGFLSSLYGSLNAVAWTSRPIDVYVAGSSKIRHLQGLRSDLGRGGGDTGNISQEIQRLTSLLPELNRLSGNRHDDAERRRLGFIEQRQAEEEERRRVFGR